MSREPTEVSGTFRFNQEGRCEVVLNIDGREVDFECEAQMPDLLPWLDEISSEELKKKSAPMSGGRRRSRVAIDGSETPMPKKGKCLNLQVRKVYTKD